MKDENNEEDFNEGRDILHRRTGKQHCKDVIFPQLTHRFNAVSTKILGSFSMHVKIDKHIIKCMWKCKGIFLVEEQ